MNDDAARKAQVLTSASRVFKNRVVYN
jgi:hypothetical protein